MLSYGNIKVEILNLPSCGNITWLLGSDGGPSPTLFTALTLNWYEAAALRFVNNIHLWSIETLLSSVTQFKSGSGIGPGIGGTNGTQIDTVYQKNWIITHCTSVSMRHL